MFDDDFDNYEPTEEDLKNPHLKEFVIKDDETMQRLFDIIEGPPTVSMYTVNYPYCSNFKPPFPAARF